MERKRKEGTRRVKRKGWFTVKVSGVSDLAYKQRNYPEPGAFAPRPKPWFGFALLDPRLGKVPRATNRLHGIIKKFLT